MCEFRFETKRLAIRDMTMDDCDIVAKAWGSFEVGKYLSDPYYKNGDELRNAFKNGELVNHENWTEDFYFVAVDKTKKRNHRNCMYMENGKRYLGNWLYYHPSAILESRIRNRVNSRLRKVY